MYPLSPSKMYMQPAGAVNQPKALHQARQQRSLRRHLTQRTEDESWVTAKTSDSLKLPL